MQFYRFGNTKFPNRYLLLLPSMNVVILPAVDAILNNLLHEQIPYWYFKKRSRRRSDERPHKYNGVRKLCFPASPHNYLW